MHPNRVPLTPDDSARRIRASNAMAAPDTSTVGLQALPAPKHLHEYLTRSKHQHFGYFESATDTLAAAQDRLVLRSARLLPRQAMVADVGCGLGGTVSLLAALGHRVYGFDSCPASIAYARTQFATSGAQFFACDLTEFAKRARGARFDALFLVEVLPNFRDLGAVFAHCRSLLRPGGLLLVHDVVCARSTPQAGEFHPRGALRAAGDSVGFDLLESREVSHRTTPTLSRLTRLLAERRDELLRVFAPTRPEIEQELEAYETRLHTLELGFTRQELFFETSFLRCSTRMTHDSVVLRRGPQTAQVPVPVASKSRPRT